MPQIPATAGCLWKVSFQCGISYASAPPAISYATAPATIGYPAAPAAMGYAPGYACNPLQLPAALQYDIRDGYGNSDFGYVSATSARQEAALPYSGCQGSYSYIDANGLLKHIGGVADAGGFRVISGTNLPIAPAQLDVPALERHAPVEDTPEVVATKAEFEVAFAANQAEH